MSQVRKIFLLRALTLISTLAISVNAVSEQWYFEPDFRARFGYDDNVRFTSRFVDSAFSTYLAANARFGVRTEVSEADFGIKLDTVAYDGHQDLDTSNQFFDMNLAYKAGLHTFRLGGKYYNDSTRTSELLTSGFVATNIPRTYRYLRPSWEWQATERASIGLGYSYSDSEYEDNERFGLIDYRYDVADFSTTYDYSERTKLQFSLNRSMYEAKDVFSEYNSYWFQVGAIHQFDETWTGVFLIGPRYTEFDFRGPGGRKESSDDTNYMLELRLSKAYETMNIGAVLRSYESPSSTGRLLRTNAAELDVNGKYSERVGYSLNTGFYRNTSTGGVDDDSQNRDYFYFEPKVSWRATRWWTISGSYRYRTQEYTSGNTGRATSNAVFLNINYIWPRESISSWSQL